LNKLKLGACPKEKIDEMMKKLKKAWEKHINTPLSD
jgi:methyl coenzyme M reductase subunit C